MWMAGGLLNRVSHMMAHKMIIPEDGCLPSITTSNSNLFNNIMVVKVDNLKAPGESTYQLATLDRSMKGTVWPADNYIKLKPGLTENKIDDEHTKASESRKELNLSIKTTTIRPKLFRPSDQNKYQFTGTGRPNLARKKNWSDRSQNCNTFCSNPEIDNIQPWLQNPWDNQLCMLPDGSLNLNLFLATPNDRHFNLSNNDFHGFCPPGDINNIHCNLSGAPPSSNGSFQNVNPEYPREDHSPNYSCYNKSRQNSRNGPNLSQHYKNNFPRNASNHGSRHDSSPVEPYNSYMKAEGKDSATNLMCELSYSANNNIGRIPHISPITLHKNYLPDFTYVSPHSLEDKYIDQEMIDSVVYNNEGMRRNNLNKISYKNSRNRRNVNRRFRNGCPRNASNRGSRHDSCPVEPCNSYLKAEGANSATNFRYKHGYFANNNIGRISHNSPITFHENYLPDSRYDLPHSSFEGNYIGQEMEGSVACDVGMHRTNSNNTPYQMHYSCARSNRKHWRNNTTFVNSNRRGNVKSNPVSKRNRNSFQKYAYKKKQRKPSMANNQNFKQLG